MESHQPEMLTAMIDSGNKFPMTIRFSYLQLLLSNLESPVLGSLVVSW